MREICLSGSMSGERKRSVAERPKLPRLSSTLPFGAGARPVHPIRDHSASSLKWSLSDQSGQTRVSALANQAAIDVVDGARSRHRVP